MSTLQFPASPSPGQSFTAENGVTYTYDSAGGGGWTATNPIGIDDEYVNIDGDTMTGDLVLPNLEASGNIQSTSQNGGQLAGFRNQIINGDFRIWQRGTTKEYTGVAPNQYSDFYLADRWHVSLNGLAGVNGTASQTSFAAVGIPGAVWGINFVQPGAVGIGMGQMIEVEPATYGQFAAGSQWTISWWTDNPNVVPYVTWASASTDATATQFTKTAKTALETIGSFTRYTSTITVSVAPRPTDSGLRVVLADSGAAPASFSITAVQLEPGPVATPFEQRPIGTELALCQRYYYSPYVIGLAVQVNANSPQTTSYAYLPTPVPMRTAPTGRSNSRNDGSTLKVYREAALGSIDDLTIGTIAVDQSALRISFTALNSSNTTLMKMAYSCPSFDAEL